MIQLTKEEIQVEVKAYQKESEKIWASSKSRAAKAELSMDLQSVHDRLAKAQLKKVVEYLDEETELRWCNGATYRVIPALKLKALFEEVKD